jgi:hypothetical protein
VSRAGLKIACAIVILAPTVGVGVPNDAIPPIETRVYPLEKQDGIWWVGIADICDLAGAVMEGADAVFPLDLPDGHRMVVGVPGADGDGPLKVVVGDDTYEFTLGKAGLQKNGRQAWDLAHVPRRINGIPSAALEDMAHMLGLAEGEEADGQPTLFRGGVRHRLVPGKPTRRINYVHITDRAGKLVWKYQGRPLTPGKLIGQLPVGKYAEHNGALYLRGDVQLYRLDTDSQVQGTETLYGPVVPHRYEAEGVTADQLYLSIVQGVARPVQMASEEARAELEAQRAALTAEREAVAGALQTLEAQAAEMKPEQEERHTATVRALQRRLRQIAICEDALTEAIRQLEAD